MSDDVKALYVEIEVSEPVAQFVEMIEAMRIKYRIPTHEIGELLNAMYLAVSSKPKGAAK